MERFLRDPTAHACLVLLYGLLLVAVFGAPYVYERAAEYFGWDRASSTASSLSSPEENSASACAGAGLGSPPAPIPSAAGAAEQLPQRPELLMQVAVFLCAYLSPLCTAARREQDLCYNSRSASDWPAV